MSEVWDKNAIILSIVLALTAIPFYVEGIFFQNVYVILAGDLPLFAAATRIWRIRLAQRRANQTKSATERTAAKSAPAKPGERLDLPVPLEAELEIQKPEENLPRPPTDFQEPVDPNGKPLNWRERFPEIEGVRTLANTLPPKRSGPGSSLRLKAKPLRFQRGTKGLNKPAFLCGCHHVHLTACMTCGMTLDKALKSKRTKWTDWDTTRPEGSLEDRPRA